jgi:hypothetical protein
MEGIRFLSRERETLIEALSVSRFLHVRPLIEEKARRDAGFFL